MTQTQPNGAAGTEPSPEIVGDRSDGLEECFVGAAFGFSKEPAT